MKSRRDRMRMRLCGCIMYLVHFKSDYLRQQQPCAALAFVVLPCLSSNEVVGGSPHGRLVADDSQVPHARYVCVCVSLVLFVAIIGISLSTPRL